MTLDFYIRLYWFDERLNMPLFWNKTSPSVQQKGIDISNMLTNDSIYMWLPDIQFNDGLEVTTLTEVSQCDCVMILRSSLYWYKSPDCSFWCMMMRQQQCRMRIKLTNHVKMCRSGWLELFLICLFFSFRRSFAWTRPTILCGRATWPPPSCSPSGSE